MSIQDGHRLISTSVAGILIFVTALSTEIYVRFTCSWNAESGYFQAKGSLSWRRMESQWLHDLKAYASGGPKDRFGNEEYRMYVSVMEELGKLEERLLELIAEAELKASNEDDQGDKWALGPKRMAFGTSFAVSVPVQRKGLELVRKMDALVTRVLFAQMSIMSSPASSRPRITRK